MFRCVCIWDEVVCLHWLFFTLSWYSGLSLDLGLINSAKLAPGMCLLPLLCPKWSNRHAPLGLAFVCGCGKLNLGLSFLLALISIQQSSFFLAWWMERGQGQCCPKITQQRRKMRLLLGQPFSTCGLWPFWGVKMTLSQGSPETTAKHRYLHYNSSHNYSYEGATKVISWLGSPQHEELY